MLAFILFSLGIIVAAVATKLRRKEKLDWSKQKAVIVGGSGAIGRALARKLKEKGVEVIAVDVKDSQIICDATDASQVSSIFAGLPDATIIINCQGIMNSGKPLIQCELSDLEKSININLLSLLYTTRAFLCNATHPFYIINVTSCLGLGGVAYLTDYCASKFGVVGFSEALRNELKNEGVGVLTVCPFWIQDSPMFTGKVNIKYPFLFRPLTTQQVAQSIISAVEQNKSELWMPWWVNFIGILRLLPTFLFDSLQQFVGSSNALCPLKFKKEISLPKHE